MERQYYEAYDDRYRQVHGESLRWFAEAPSPIVYDTVREFGIEKQDRLLELGCGEGRDARFLLEKGYDLLATDISPAAVEFCQREFPEYREHFRVLDCVKNGLPERFDFLYAVAVIHMLVPDADRNRFYGFIRAHLTQKGIALICTMGDGITERHSDISTAFTLQDRVHEATGRLLQLAGTSYRGISFDTFHAELHRNGLEILKEGITLVEPDYGKMMYAVVKKAGP